MSTSIGHQPPIMTRSTVSLMSLPQSLVVLVLYETV